MSPDTSFGSLLRQAPSEHEAGVGDGSERADARVSTRHLTPLFTDSVPPASTFDPGVQDVQNGAFPAFHPDVAERLVAVAAGERSAGVARMVAIEQYRKLAASLHQVQAEGDARVVLITSAVADEGKTFTATNLALTLSESFRRSVLLIDADLRRPGLHRLFRVPGTPGLGDTLADETRTKAPLVALSPRLALLPAGSPCSDPMSVLASPQMRRLVEESSRRFSWVIVDAPPVGLLTDGSLIADLAHAVLMVVQAGRTDYTIVRRAIETIGDRVLGVVLNRVELRNSAASYKYGRYYTAYSPDAKGSRR